MAVCAIGSWLCAGPKSGAVARRVCVPPALLFVWGGGYQLFRLRPAELSRLSGAQGLAGFATGWAGRLCEIALRGYPAGARAISACRSLPRTRGIYQFTKHHYLPL